MKKFFLVPLFIVLALSVLAQGKGDASRQFEERRAEAVKSLKERQDAFEKIMQEKRNALQERIAAKRTELQSQLRDKIRDETKRTIVERINQRLDELNAQRVEHFANTLEQLENVLDRIVSRTDKAELNGRDVLAVRAAISAAQKAIAASKSALETQAGKTYTIAVNSDGLLKKDVGDARQSLHTDLVGTRQTVRAARVAVQGAATILGGIKDVDSLEVTAGAATSSQ